MIRNPDVASGAVLAALAAFLFYSSWQIEYAEYEQVSARFMPLLASGTLGVIGIIIAAKGLLAGKSPWPFVANARVIGLAAIFLAYFLTFTHVDFRLGAWAVTLSSMFLLGARKPLTLILVPVCVAIAAFLIFRYAFQILLPSWI